MMKNLITCKPHKDNEIIKPMLVTAAEDVPLLNLLAYYT